MSSGEETVVVDPSSCERIWLFWRVVFFCSRSRMCLWGIAREKPRKGEEQTCKSRTKYYSAACCQWVGTPHRDVHICRYLVSMYLMEVKLGDCERPRGPWGYRGGGDREHIGRQNWQYIPVDRRWQAKVR